MTTDAFVLTLFPIDDTLASGAGGRERCGRPRKDGQPCLGWPRRDAPACAHHIKAVELAVVEQLHGRPSAAA